MLNCKGHEQITRIDKNALTVRSSSPEAIIAKIFEDAYQRCQNNSVHKQAVIIDNWMHQLNVSNELYRLFSKMIYEYPSV